MKFYLNTVNFQYVLVEILWAGSFASGFHCHVF